MGAQTSSHEAGAEQHGHHHAPHHAKAAAERADTSHVFHGLHRWSAHVVVFFFDGTAERWTKRADVVPLRCDDTNSCGQLHYDDEVFLVSQRLAHPLPLPDSWQRINVRVFRTPVDVSERNLEKKCPLVASSVLSNAELEHAVDGVCMLGSSKAHTAHLSADSECSHDIQVKLQQRDDNVWYITTVYAKALKSRLDELRPWAPDSCMAPGVSLEEQTERALTQETGDGAALASVDEEGTEPRLSQEQPLATASS